MTTTARILPTGIVSDARLVANVGSVVSRPRTRPADSFVLHAPLELAARAALLPFVAPEHRDSARERIASIAADYEAFAAPVVEPPVRSFETPEGAALHLRGAIAAGDLDDVDAVAAWLGRTANAVELQLLLADEVLSRLAAAAHAPIFLFQLPRVAPRGELPAALIRPLLRELARYPEWQLTWIDSWSDLHVAAAGSGKAGSLFDALASVPERGVPGSDFIFPVMSQVDANGVAATALAPHLPVADFDEATRVLTRVAALSMLLEPSDYAPYGWSHCLTMPQAVMGIAGACSDQMRAFAVAATYVVGFRAAFARRPLAASYAPENPGLAVAQAFAAGGEPAAAAAWHTPASEHGSLVTELASRAATHHDAHLVKYTLACFDAASHDPQHVRLYLAAAASLVGYWTTSH